MERVTFLVERTGERIPCLLNPEFLEVRRTAGIVRRRGAGGAVIGNPRTDDPLIATGGGTTDYELKLLFDVDLLTDAAASSTVPVPTAATVVSGDESPADFSAALTSSAALEEGDTTESGSGTEEPADDPEPDSGTEEPAGDPEPVAEESAEPLPAPAASSIDVRTLTQPLWALAENGEPVSGMVAPQRVRFIWGRSWNVPGVILAVAERHERFDSQGVPKRSWLSMLLRRVEEQVEAGSTPPAPTSSQFEMNTGSSATDDTGDDSVVIPVDDEGVALTPLHMIAAERYGDPRYDRAIAEYNDLDDLLEVEEGRPIRLPPASSVAAEA